MAIRRNAINPSLLKITLLSSRKRVLRRILRNCGKVRSITDKMDAHKRSIKNTPMYGL